MNVMYNQVYQQPYVSDQTPRRTKMRRCFVLLERTSFSIYSEDYSTLYIKNWTCGCTIGIGMSWTEHTPQEHSMREAPAEPPVSPASQKPTEPHEEINDPCPSDSHTQTVHVRELHLYTIPNREYSGHYPNSPLFADIAQNPALYMDRADF